jgi:DNA ligase-1
MSDPCHRVISDLEMHSSRLNKEQIIQAQAEFGNDDFFAGCRLAFDSMITFGLKQIKEKTDEDGPGLSWSEFNSVATRFINRDLTGNAARDAVDQLMAQATKAEWNGWYRRILIKDMRAGFSESTLNKVVSKINAVYCVPVFSCQLAHDSTNHESKVTGSKLLEIKLDGVRVLTIVHPDGRVDQFSRNGKELVNFPHVKAQFAAVAKQFTEAMVFDGEIMSSSFQDLMRQVHRKSDVQSSDAELYLFDWMPLSEFEAGKSKKPQQQRSAELEAWFEDKMFLQLVNVKVVKQELVDLDSAAGAKRFKEINTKAIDGGYEGIMIKDPKAYYETKRSVAWLKLKPFIEVSLAVVGFEEGTGKNIGKLGALICEGTDDGKFIHVNVGGGYSDDQRDTYWQDRQDLLGKIVEVRADAVTQNQDGSYSLRFPRFRSFRGFENGEKI